MATTPDPVDPITPEHVVPATRRRVLTMVATVVALTLITNVVAAVVLARRPVNRGHWLLRAKWELLARAPAVETVVLGDSTCNQGVDPAVLAEALGGSVLNLCTMGDVLAVNDAWMLEAYLRRHAPRRVIVIHTYDIWDRAAGDRFAMLLGKLPLPFGFWDDFRLRIDLDVGEHALVAAGRWVPLYSDERSLRQLIQSPRKALGRRFELTADGFMRVTRAAPGNVRRDAVAHLAGLPAVWAPSEINRRALSVLGELAAERRVELVIAPAPIYEGLYADPRMAARLAEIERWIRAAVGPGATVIAGPPPTFAAERMENVDHVVAEAAGEYTRWLADRVRAR